MAQVNYHNGIVRTSPGQPIRPLPYAGGPQPSSQMTASPAALSYIPPPRLPPWLRARSSSCLSLPTMSERGRIQDLLDAMEERISTMSGRCRVSSTDFDLLYQSYQEDATSTKGLYGFIMDHSYTHDVARKVGMKPIDVLARMVGKTTEACLRDLEVENDVYQDAMGKAAKASGRGDGKSEK